MKKISAIALLLVMSFPVMGQSLQDAYNATLPQVMEPTPQTRLFQKYVNHPVTEYNGLPQIEIPLYEIKIKGLTIPISLSYHAGGIKYMQYDGDVGAGWNIGAGGYRVSRTIYGKPDEKTHLYDEEALARVGYPSWERDCLLAGMFLKAQEATLAVNKIIDPINICDSRQDLFMYQAPTSNGHFIITDRTNRQVDVLAKNKDRIDLSDGSSPFQNMHIYDTDGIKYIFGENGLKESTTVDYSNEETSWPLTRILSPFNEEVVFKYKMIHVVRGEQKNTLSIQSAFRGVYNPATPATSYAQTYVDTHTYSSELMFYSLFVDEIITDNEIVKFHRQTGLNREHIINAITITDKRDNRQLFNIVFSYTQDVISRGSPHLLLDKITISGSDNSILPQEYSFNYYLPSWGNQILAYPDQWGYYKNFMVDVGNVATMHSELGDIRYEHSTFYYGSTGGVFGDFRPVSQIGEAGWYPRTLGDPDPNQFSLKRITFPTGGYREFEYESHQFKHNNNLIYGGGLRVKKISSVSGTGENITTTYKYGINESGEGNPNIPMDAYKNFFVDVSHYICDSGMAANPGATSLETYPTLIFGEKPLVSEASDFKVNYSCVTKYEQAGGLNNGKTVSFYNVSPYYYGCGVYQGGVITSPNSINFPERYEQIGKVDINKKEIGTYPVLSKQLIYNGSEKIVTQKVFSYASLDIQTYIGQKVKRSIMGCNGNNSPLRDSPVSYEYVNSQFADMPFSLNYYSQLIASDKSITYTYENNVLADSVIVYQTYDYDNLNRLTKTVQTNSLGNNLVKELTYPSAGTALVNRNILSTVISTVTTHNSREIGRINNVYPTTAILPSAIQTSSSGSSGMRTDVTFNLYDSYGNIRQYTTLDGVSTTYLWGYDGQYPIAEIKNATFAEVEAAVRTIFAVASADALATRLTPDEVKLRNGSLQRALPNAFVTTFTYKPLVGILTSTDPSGLTTYYEYDSFGRLFRIKDHEGKAMEGYEYNYAQ